MRGMGLRGVIRGKPVRTTISDKAAPSLRIGPVNRQFHAPRPNALWVSDFTYVSTWTGFVYALRLCSGRLWRGAFVELPQEPPCGLRAGFGLEQTMP